MNPAALFWLDCIAKSIVLITLAFATTLALRRSSATTRHLVWVATFAGLLFLPLLQELLPSRALFTLPTRELPAVAAPEGPPIAAPAIVHPTPEGESFRVVDQSAQPTPASSSPEPEPNPLRLPVLVWLIVSGALLSYNLAGRALALALAHRSEDAGSHLDIDGLRLRSNLRRPVKVRWSGADYPEVPMTWGVRRPLVLLPLVSKLWPPQRTESVLLHEFAHVRRLDVLSQSLSALVCTLYWFNPLVWLAARVMRSEAEYAADDCVLARGRTPSSYAEDLVYIAAGINHRRFLPLPGVTIMKSSKIERRIQAILDPDRIRRGVTSLQLLAVVSAAAAILAALGMVRSAQAQEAAPGPSDPIVAHRPLPSRTEPALLAPLSPEKTVLRRPHPEPPALMALAQADKEDAQKKPPTIMFVSTGMDMPSLLKLLHRPDVRSLVESMRHFRGKWCTANLGDRGDVWITATSAPFDPRLHPKYKVVDGIYVVADTGKAATEHRSTPAAKPGLEDIVPAFEAEQQDVREALKTLFKGPKIDYFIARDVQGTISVSLRNVTLSTALDNICRQVGATWRVEHGMVKIENRPALEPDPVVTSIQFDQADVREALRKILTMGQFSFSIAPEVQGTVSVSMKNVTTSTLLTNICQSVGASWKLEGGVVKIEAAHPAAPVDQPGLDLKFVGADMIAATTALSKRTGIKFLVVPSPEPFHKVTLQITGTTPEDALRYICQAAGASFRRDDKGTYIISH